MVDPVAASMTGHALLREDALEAIRTELFPRATLITPNLDEVRLLTGISVVDAASQRSAAEALLEFGSQWVLVKGGHMQGTPECVDLLSDGDSFLSLSGPRYETENTHGGGDTLASAITSSLAKGASVPDAVARGRSSSSAAWRRPTRWARASARSRRSGCSAGRREWSVGF